jgi:hypothetical protein
MCSTCRSHHRLPPAPRPLLIVEALGRYRPRACGPLTVAVSVRGKHLPKSPFKLDIASGPAFAPNCRLADRRPSTQLSLPARGGAIEVLVMRRAKIPVQAYDSLHNMCTSGGFVCTVLFCYAGNTSPQVAGTWEDLANGLYNARIKLPNAGRGELAIRSAADGCHIAGRATLHTPSEDGHVCMHLSIYRFGQSIACAYCR